MRLAPAHVMRGLERLLEVYPRPKHAPAEAEPFAQIYADVCGALSEQQFAAAVDEYRAGTGRFFPTPGQLLALGRAASRGANGDGGSLEDRYRLWEQQGFTDGKTGGFVPCPVCEAIVEALPPAGRLGVRHDHQRHYLARVGYVGLRTGPVDDQSRMIAATGPRP